jgi:SAM-dependent methyltransferase
VITGTTLRRETVDQCDLCGSDRQDVLLTNLRDRLHHGPGHFALIRCVQCGLVRLSPRPDRESMPRYYPADGYSCFWRPGKMRNPARSVGTVREALRSAFLRAHGYDEPIPWWGRLIPRRVPAFAMRRATYGLTGFPDWVPGGRALDLGCGNGVFLHCISRHGWETVGVDISPAAAALAHECFGIRIHVGELGDAQIKEGSLDFVRMNHVIEHLWRPVATLRRIAALLRPGGRLYVETPNIGSLGFKWSHEYWFPLEAPRHLWLFSAATLTQALEETGFTIRSLRSRSLPTFDWEASYIREDCGWAGRRPGPPGERFVRQIRALRDVDRGQRARAATLTVVSQVASRLSPRFGEILSCWAERDC